MVHSAWRGQGSEESVRRLIIGTCLDERVDDEHVGRTAIGKVRFNGMNARRKYTIQYDPTFIVEGGSLTTVTKADRIAEAAGREFGDRIVFESPEPATLAELRQIHTDEYVDAIQTGEPFALAEGGLGSWSPQVRTSVLASTGGARTAALRALENGVAGSLSSGLHHARHDRGSGFCTLNGLALAAHAARDAGAAEVGILDVDAHCGGGTFDICGVEPWIRIADVSVSSFDRWTPIADRHSLVIDSDPSAYLDHVRRALSALEGVSLVLHNAGMDPVEGGEAGATTGFTSELMAEREDLIADWARRTGTPIAFVLAGGYTGPRLTIEQVVALHMHTIRAFAS